MAAQDPAQQRPTEDKAAEASGKGGAMNSRWWESYLVRYFIGSLVGCVVLACLLHTVFHGQAWFDDKMKGLGQGQQSDLTTALLVIFGLAGLCYCYIASSPITVFHATRMLKGGDPLGIPPTPVWTWWLLSGVLLLVGSSLGPKAVSSPTLMAAGALWMAAPAIYALLSQITKIAHLVADEPGQRRLGTPFIGTLLGMLGLGTKQPATEDVGEFEKFYLDIAVRRAPLRGLAQAEDYRASYTHLREHSNSVFIVLLEVSFGALLWLLMRNQPDPITRILSATIMVCVWLAPNIYLWGQANRLEEALRDGKLAERQGLD